MAHKPRAIRFLLVILMLLLATPAWAVPMEFISTSVDSQANTVQWTIQFQNTPDFFTVDQYGRQKDDFVIFAYTGPVVDPTIPYSNITSVTLGGAIHLDEGLLLVSPLSVFAPDPDSLGWGHVYERDAFIQNGTFLSYQTSLNGIGAVNGHFSFDVLTTADFGAGGILGPPLGQANGFFFPSLSIGCASDNVCANPIQSVPEPNTLELTIMGMLGLAGFLAWRRRRVVL